MDFPQGPDVSPNPYEHGGSVSETLTEFCEAVKQFEIPNSVPPDVWKNLSEMKAYANPRKHDESWQKIVFLINNKRQELIDAGILSSIQNLMKLYQKYRASISTNMQYINSPGTRHMGHNSHKGESVGDPCDVCLWNAIGRVADLVEEVHGLHTDVEVGGPTEWLLKGKQMVKGGGLSTKYNNIIKQVQDALKTLKVNMKTQEAAKKAAVKAKNDSAEIDAHIKKIQEAVAAAEAYLKELNVVDNEAYSVEKMEKEVVELQEKKKQLATKETAMAKQLETEKGALATKEAAMEKQLDTQKKGLETKEAALATAKGAYELAKSAAG